MTKGKGRERRQARTRAAIVQAAEEIIEVQGPEALNMRAVAERIDYSASNLYEYFAGKDELLAAVIKEALTRLTAHVRHISSNLPPAERLQAYGHAYLEFARTHPRLYVLIFGRKLTHTSDDLEEYPSPYLLLREVVAEGIAAGIFVPRPGFGLEEMAFGCWSLAHGMSMLHLTAQDESWQAPLPSDDQILACFTAGLRIR